MKKQLALALFLLLSFTTFSQIKFEKGYFIDNYGEKTECLIKNMDWLYNPDEFTYKLSESDTQKNANISTVKEFGVFGEFVYERHNVQVDISPTDLKDLEYFRNPKWESKTVFLKFLVEGEANLYEYLKDNSLKFFYNTSVDTNVKQLVFKEYLIEENKIAKNLTYINQLYKEINCKGLTIDKIKRVDYDRSDLVKYFEENKYCLDPSEENINKHRVSKGKFNIKITPGVNLSSFSMINTLDVFKNSYDFDSEINFRIGAELEYVFPFHKNKWSLFIDPNYYSYSSYLEKDIENSWYLEITDKVDISIRRLAIPFGVRHYFFLSDRTKIFVNAGFSYDNDLSSSIHFVRGEDFTDSSYYHLFGGPEVLDQRGDLGLNSSFFHFFSGLGANFDNKYSIEVRYFSPDYMINNYIYWESNFDTISFVLGYNFL